MSDSITVCGRVSRLFYSNEESAFSAGVLCLESGKEVRFGGKVLAKVGEQVEVTGRYTTHPKYGRQFEVETGLAQLEETPEALTHLLASHADFQGIGPSRARGIVEAALLFADDDGDFGQALSEHSSSIADRAKVPLDLVEKAAEVWNDRKEHFGALAAIVNYGWSTSQAHAILSHYGARIGTQVANSEPYQMIGKVPRFGFRTVDAVAVANGVERNDPARLGAGVCYCLDRIAEDGHTWATREFVVFRALEELRPDTLEGELEIEKTLDELIEKGLVVQYESPIDGSLVVADKDLEESEVSVFTKLRARLTRERDPIVENDRVSEILGLLNRGQKGAVEAAVSGHLTVISGGAGTGKTFATRSICEIVESLGYSVALCAPTGKASKRLEESTGRDAVTIHRLLEPIFDRGRFKFTRHSGNPLECDYLIVDESSMIDVRLMASLLSAVTDQTRVVLVGDHNQIPSVGPGAILRDLLEVSQDFPDSMHVLTEVVRQAGVLAQNTIAILDGVVSTNESSVWGIDRLERGQAKSGAARIAQTVEFLVTEEVEPFNRPLDFAWEIQVLAPMRKGDLGTYALNAELQRLRQRLLGNPIPPPIEVGKRPKPLVGDRIIWTKNDYELGLLNGTQALVLEIKKGGDMKIQTEAGRKVEIPSGKRDRVELAYAMTIHKSQGSEWPCVILCVSTLHAYMKDRNLLYTGASRAAKSLTIVGDMAGIKLYAKALSSKKRQTFGSWVMAYAWERDEVLGSASI